MTKAKGPSKNRAAAEAGNWNVADPVPFIIDILKRVLNYENESAMPVAARTELRNEVIALLEAWNRREDEAEMVELLGLKRDRGGGRRKQSTVNRDRRFALAHAEHVARGTPDPFETVMVEFSIEDDKQLRRAIADWGALESTIVAESRKHLGNDYRIDYSEAYKDNE